MCRLWILLFVGLSACLVHAEKPTLFVAPLDGDISQIQAWQPALGEGLAEMLITELSDCGKFDVLESTALEELMDEIHLGEAGYVEEEEKVERGGYSAADFMFRGKVTRFGSKNSNVDLGGFVPGGFGGLGIKSSRSDVRIDWRIVDTATRKIVASGKANGSEEGMGFDIGVGVDGHGGNIGFGNSEFMNSALGKATVKAVNQIVEDVEDVSVPESGRKAKKAKAAAARKAELENAVGRILAAPDKSAVIVSLGSQNGLENGDELQVYKVEKITDDEGNVVFEEEKSAGKLVLTDVQDDRSKGEYKGWGSPEKDWVVKRE